MAQPNLKTVAVFAAAISVAALVYAIGEFAYRRDAALAAESRLQTQLTSLSNRFLTEIAAGTDLGMGLAAVVAAEPNINERKFSAICRTILAAQPKVNNIALIVGDMVRYNCPVGGPPREIGSEPGQGATEPSSFEKLKQASDAVVSGPIRLNANDWLIVVRIPIRIKSETGLLKYWGAISVPMRVSGILQQAGLADPGIGLDLAMRGSREPMRTPEILFGDPGIFKDDIIQVPVALPEGTWFLAARLNTVPTDQQTLQRLFIGIVSIACGAGAFVAIPYVARRRRLEAEVNRNRDLLRALMRNSPIAMYVKDVGGRYLDLNDEAFRAYRLGGQDYIGRTARDLVSPELAKQLELEDARALGGEVIRAERKADPSSEYLWEREIKFPVIDHAGKVIAIAGYVLDITGQKQSEARMLEALRRAEAANREKSNFLATMSHELRTPLNAIIGFSDILRRQMFGPLGSSTYQSYAADIHKSGQLLYDLLGGIIDLSAVEAGHLTVKEESLTAEQVIDDCRAVLEALSRERDHSLTVHVDTSAAILGDRRLLRQVIINLTSNATKYTRKGGQIDVTVADRGDNVVFTVRDNGIGMEPADIERALQPFTRLGDPMRAEVGGSGIGLALVKRLVEAMRGSLVITSAPGIGTTVEVQLPKVR
ncbi:sensor histidine kinase [Dongia rigui]|uniref:histidine kinase n=1 Tax=Dongia rigui TaxID=940149 RepID=A0ABU5DTJ8_9PROT|nr:ATP-binding protein [Dongia rigui]MDY0870651.1 ATP-binding protein [Dongia rigui]